MPRDPLTARKMFLMDNLPIWEVMGANLVPVLASPLQVCHACSRIIHTGMIAVERLWAPLLSPKA